MHGDMLALIMTLAIALMVCIYSRHPQTPSRGPAALMALLLIPAGHIFAEPFSLHATEIGLCLLFGVVFAFASVSLAGGARRLPAAEAALLSALELPFAVLWAALHCSLQLTPRRPQALAACSSPWQLWLPNGRANLLH